MGENVQAVVAGNNEFALDLYAKLREGGPDNLFFSPASLSTALAMTYAGARGETAEQMARVLHFILSPPELQSAFAVLGQSWSSDIEDQGRQLSIANRLWGQEGLRFLPDYLAVTRDAYGAELARVDFRHDAETARHRINTWVEEQTQDKIKNLIPAGALDALTRLVLTNAVYFKGKWSSPFVEDLTRDEPFYAEAGQETTVPLMYRQGRYRLWAGEGLKVLELPYDCGELVMLVVLPDAVDGLAELESRLSVGDLNRWIAGLRSQEVVVHLPRFTITAEFQLGGVFKTMGMSVPFDPGRADFSGMATEENLAISAVVHKAFVSVNEEGTEAAAATGVLMFVLAAAPRPPVEFRADHPFLFLIRDNRNGSILFLGRLRVPGS